MPLWLDRSEWPYEARFHDAGPGRMHYVDVGTGAPVLASHGTPTWAYDWRHLMRGLPERRWIAVDHLGFGLSDRPDAGYRPEDHAERFAGFADGLDLRGATVVIHDFGGPFALPWVLANLDRVERLVVINTFAWSIEDFPRMRQGASVLGSGLGRWLYGWANLSLRVISPSAYADRRVWRGVRDAYLGPFPDAAGRQQVLWALAHSLLGSSAFFASIERDLPKLADTRVDLVWGMKDTAFGPEQLARWTERVPHAGVTRIADAGHWPHEEAPDAVIGALRVDQNDVLEYRSRHEQHA